MKNLLVDALRQAKSDQAEQESDDAVRLGETPIEGASNDGDEFVEESHDETLSLMQTTTNLVVVDVEVEVDDEAADEANAGEGAGPAADAAFAEAFEIDGVDRSRDRTGSGGAEPVRHGRPDGLIEHSARWLPVACVLLLVSAMGALPVWKGLMSDEGDLGRMVEGAELPVEAASATGTAGSQAGSSRFPYASASSTSSASSATAAPVTTTRVAPPVTVDPPAQRPEVLIQVRERRPAGATDLRDDTFSSLDALYRAYLAGEVSRGGLAEILDARVRQQEPGTESEIKLLLQQYPDDSVLHNALGTLLAEQSRWPEARAAFARAAETAEGAR